MEKIKTLKKILTAIVLCFGALAIAASCSDDEKKEPEPVIDPLATPAQKVEGSYTGNMTCAIMNQEVGFENMTFKFKATGDATVDVTIPTFSYSGYDSPVAMVIPEINVAGVKVSGEKDTYNIAETKFGGTSDAGKKYSGVLKGTSVGGQLTFNFNLTLGSMPMPMICTFTGSRKSD